MVSGKGYPRRVTAMGGKYAIEDNREIPDTMEVIWEYEGGPLVTFSQTNSNASPTSPRKAEIVVRGSKGTMYLMGGKWEIVPEQVTDQEFFARTPLDRESERASRTSQDPRWSRNRRGRGRKARRRTRAISWIA